MKKQRFGVILVSHRRLLPENHGESYVREQSCAMGNGIAQLTGSRGKAKDVLQE